MPSWEAAKNSLSTTEALPKTLLPKDDPDGSGIQTPNGQSKEKEVKLVAELERQKEEKSASQTFHYRRTERIGGIGMMMPTNLIMEFKKLQQQWNETKLVPQR